MIVRIHKLRQHVQVVMRLVLSKVLPHAGFQGPIESLDNRCFHITPCGEMLDWRGSMGTKKVLHLRI